MKYLILLLFLVSCGGDDPEAPSGTTSDTSSGVTCNTDVTQVRKVWKSQSSGTNYDLTHCGAATNCRLCMSNYCNTFEDFELSYYDDGTLVINYFMVPKVHRGTWQICDGELELYNIAGNSEIESFSEGE